MRRPVGLPRHLGGHSYNTHLDDGALEWMIKKFNIKSMLDVGCGPGGMVELANSKRLTALGIDGDYSLVRDNQELFKTHDYTKGPCDINQKFDLIWSCEFVEHVVEEFLPNFIESFLLGKYLIITYAPKGWLGMHHVNCQDEQYWINKMACSGLIYHTEYTKELRRVSTMNTANPRVNPSDTFVKDRGLFFINESFF